MAKDQRSLLALALAKLIPHYLKDDTPMLIASAGLRMDTYSHITVGKTAHAVCHSWRKESWVRDVK